MWFKFLIGILLTTQAFAWRFTQDFENGFYWQSLPVPLTIIDSNPTRKQMLQELTVIATNEWERGTRLDLWNLTEGSGNVLRWSDNFQAETNMDPLSVLAVAIRYTVGPYFSRTEIVINGSHPLNRNRVHLLTTIIHELGHTMGLDHSEKYEAIMAPTLQESTSITFDDRDGMRAAHKETAHRQTIGFISPLAAEDEVEKNALSCGTVAPATAGPNTFISLAAGLLIAFVRKIFKWVKSLF